MGLGQINRAQYNHSLSNEPKAKTNIAIIFNNIATQQFQLNTRVKNTSISVITEWVAARKGVSLKDQPKTDKKSEMRTRSCTN